MSDESLSALVRELLPLALQAHAETGAPVAEILHAYIWPRLCGAVQAELSASFIDIPAAVNSRDRRSKPWQYVVRFWVRTPNGPELVGETDPQIMHGTGEIPNIIAHLASEVHEEGVPNGLLPDAVKLLLPQFRNNLGRANNASLRISYEYVDMGEGELGGRAVDYLCQMDVYRLSEA